MSRSAGTGSPLNFRCAACRRRETCLDFKSRKGWSGDVELTGNTKKRQRASPRHGTVLHQYRCRSCGHVGYSAHNDLARKAEAEAEAGALPPAHAPSTP